MAQTERLARKENALFWRYTRRYLLAMSLVGGAILLGAFQINQALELNRREGAIISTASTQQRLAQQLVLLPERIEAETNNYSRNLTLDVARNAVNEMRAGHDFLVNGHGDDVPPAADSDALNNLYETGGLNLNQNVERLLDAYDFYLDDPDAGQEAVRVASFNAENFLLILLERAVELHTAASEAKIDHAITLHRFWFTIALGLFGFIILFVFRPLARNAAKTVVAMSAEIDEGANLLSKSFKIAKLGHWRLVSPYSEKAWFSKELIDLLALDLDEGAHPRKLLQLGKDVIDPLSNHGAMNRVWNTGLPDVARSTFQKPNGDVIELLIHLDAELDSLGNVEAVVGVVKDDTAEAQAERALVKSYDTIERKSNDLIEAQRLGKLGTFRLPLGSNRVGWDESAYFLMGFDPSEFDPCIENIGRLYLDDGFARITALKENVVQTGETQSVLVQARTGSGAVIDLQIQFKLQVDDQGEPAALFGTMQDVSVERAAARELEKLAFFDGLTGLANRTLFNRELSRVSADCADGDQRAALLIIDLDHFKEVNDTLGHQAGDELLGIVGSRLTQIFADIGFVARLGGDEFAVIVENYPSKNDIDQLCKDIIKNISIPATLSSGMVQTNASIGVALAATNSSQPDELFSFADLALYSSKAQGRGRASYYAPSFSKALEVRTSLAAKIRSALDHNRFEAHYQPIVDVATQTVSGFEALLRLPTDDGKYIPPSQFIPIAESSHLIADLGSFILHEACRAAQSWLADGQPRRTISVNVSAAQIWHGDLEQVVVSALDQSGLDPQLLCIELTESVFVADNFDKLDEILCRLKSRGIQLALDDFGTGYSSLGYLNRLPFDILKIDRMFVTNAHVSAEKRKMLRGVFSLAKGLDLKVTAEGIESQEEFELVRGLGCDVAQGWYFSRALPSDDAILRAEQLDQQSCVQIGAVAV